MTIQPSKFIYDLEQQVIKKILELKETDVMKCVIYSRVLCILQKEREYAELDETEGDV